jgi:hypothetical protein
MSALALPYLMEMSGFRESTHACMHLHWELEELAFIWLYSYISELVKAEIQARDVQVLEKNWYE